nr:hypothetical protein [Tanacetum cinerariifolium]
MSIEIRKKEKLLQLEQWANLSTHPSTCLNAFFYDDDDDDEDYTISITPNEPVLSIEELDNSLSMGDEHLDIIPATESDEVIKSSVENLISIPSESEGIPEHKCDVPFHDNSLPRDVSKDQFEDFSKSNDEFSSTDDDSFSLDNIDYVEASPLDSELVSSKVMEIVTPEVGGIKASNDNPIPFYDPIISETPPNLTPSGESDFFRDEDVLEKIVSKPLSEEEIVPTKSLRTHDSSLPISSKIDSLLDDESFSSSPILVKDSDSLKEEINLFCTPDYPMPPGIMDEYYDSERDILIPKDFPSNNTLSFAEKESLHFDIPLFSRPPAKAPDGDTGILNIKMTGDISDQKAFMHKLMITLAPHQEKSPDLLSHRCGTVKKFNTHRSHLNKCPMLIMDRTILPRMFFCSIFIPIDSLKVSENFDLIERVEL